MLLKCLGSSDSGTPRGPFNTAYYYKGTYRFAAEGELRYAPPASYFRIKPTNLVTGVLGEYGAFNGATWQGLGLTVLNNSDGGNLSFEPNNAANFFDGSRDRINQVDALAGTIQIPPQGLCVPGSFDSANLAFFNTTSQDIDVSIQALEGRPSRYSYPYKVTNNGEDNVFSPVPPFAIGVRMFLDTNFDTPGFTWLDIQGDTSVVWPDDQPSTTISYLQNYQQIPPGAIAFGFIQNGLNVRYALEWLIEA